MTVASIAPYSENVHMSQVIRSWIIWVEENMPSGMKNSDRWQSLLSSAAETGRNFERERLELILNWMWDTLSRLQSRADAYGFGEAWEKMLTEKTKEAAWEVGDTASDWICRDAANAAAEALRAIPLTEFSVDWVTHVAAWATESVCIIARFGKLWDDVDPFSFLERLINNG